MGDIRMGGVTPLSPREIFKPVPEIGGVPETEGKASFGNMIKDVVQEAVQSEQGATQAIEEFTAGSLNDVHDVVLAVNKANMAVTLLVQIRNGMLEAYQELSRIQI